MKPWYATNARDLLEARRQGMVPNGPVVVSLIGGGFDKVAAATLYVHDDTPIERLDWRMLVNLEVWLWASGSVPLDRVLHLLDAIARVRPRRLCLRFDHAWSWVSDDGIEFKADTHDVDVGTGYHVPAIRDLPAVHEFHWEPIALNWTPIERRLQRAALGKHALGTVL